MTHNYRDSENLFTICFAALRAINSQWLAGMWTFCFTSTSSMQIGRRKSEMVHSADSSAVKHSFQNYQRRPTSSTSMTNTHGYHTMAQRQFEPTKRHDMNSSRAHA